MNYLIGSLLKHSSEIPFVSGIMNKTNTSWRTTIPAKSMKTYPGFGNADKATGMKSVIRAASTRWTEHPNDWPWALRLSRKISEIKTQIMAP